MGNYYNYMSDLDDVNELIKLGKGDQSRLEHVRTSLESNKVLYESDKTYLRQLVDENLTKNDSESESIENSTETNPEFCGKCGVKISDKTSNFCSKCGARRNENSESFCGKCGQKLHNRGPCPNCQNFNSNPTRMQRPVEWKSESTTLVLSIILGLFGIQGVGHLYIGKIGKGIAYLIGSIIILSIGLGLSMTGVGAIIGVPFLIIYFVMFILQILDSKKLCRYYNDYLEEHNERPW